MFQPKQRATNVGSAKAATNARIVGTVHQQNDLEPNMVIGLRQSVLSYQHRTVQGLNLSGTRDTWVFHDFAQVHEDLLQHIECFGPGRTGMMYKVCAAQDHRNCYMLITRPRPCRLKQTNAILQSWMQHMQLPEDQSRLTAMAILVDDRCISLILTPAVETTLLKLLKQPKESMDIDRLQAIFDSLIDGLQDLHRQKFSHNNLTVASLLVDGRKGILPDLGTSVIHNVSANNNYDKVHNLIVAEDAEIEPWHGKEEGQLSDYIQFRRVCLRLLMSTKGLLVTDLTNHLRPHGINELIDLLEQYGDCDSNLIQYIRGKRD